MPRRKNEGYALAEDGTGNLAPVRVSSGGDGVEAVPRVQAPPHGLESASEAFQRLLARDDGWLRCTGDGGSKVNYFKWKFSSGTHRGKYVMYVAPVGAWSEGILGLAEKVEEVDLGFRKPAHDTFYDPR